MVYTNHLWWLGGWVIIAIPTLCPCCSLTVPCHRSQRPSCPTSSPSCSPLLQAAHKPAAAEDFLDMPSLPWLHGGPCFDMFCGPGICRWSKMKQVGERLPRIWATDSLWKCFYEVSTVYQARLTCNFNAILWSHWSSNKNHEIGKSLCINPTI